MGKSKKAFKDTILGKILSKAKGVVIDSPKIIAQIATGNIIGAIATASGALAGSPNSDDHKLINELSIRAQEIDVELKSIELEELRVKEENITSRWSSDMNSDSWMSKNARPTALYWVLLMATVLLITSWCNIETPDGILTLFGGMSTSILGGYFILRSVEKRNKNKYG